MPDFAALIEQQVAILKQEKAQEEALQQQFQQKGRQEAIAKVQQELAHLLDDSWDVRCEVQANPYATQSFEYQGGQFSLTVVRNGSMVNCPAQAATNYQATLTCLQMPNCNPQGSVNSEWVEAQKLSLEFLARFCAQHIEKTYGSECDGES